MTRRLARITAMQILYNADFMELSIEEATKKVDSSKLDDSVVYFLNLVKNNLEKIDEIIENNLVNYHLNRLNYVDRAIIRLATAEMLEKTTPTVIIINEALDITKEFSDQGDNKAVAFNNKVLDTISKDLA